MHICSVRMPVRAQLIMLTAAVLAAYPAAPCRARDAAAASSADVGALLAGRYDNSAQVAQGKAAVDDHPPQHVVITIEPTQRADWEIWRVHMDVDSAVAQAAGSDESLDAVWALNISRPAPGKPLQLIPYTLRPSLDEASAKASAFDQGQWLPLEACALNGNLGKSRIVAQSPADEMCVAETMGLGGKRAFLPSWIEREGDSLHVQLIYFGKPWRVDARRVEIPSHDGHPMP
jgi:hypothetical protein